jgi:hypothetical protein
MLTCLDHWVRDFTRDFKTRNPSGYSELKRRNRWVVSDVALTGLLAMRAVCGFDAVTGRPDPALEYPLPPQQSAMFHAVMVFCLPRDQLDKSWAPPKAIQPSAALLEDFKDARPPRTTEHVELLRKYTWYMDIPQGSLPYDDESEIRCLFVVSPHDRVVLVAGAARRNSNVVDRIGSYTLLEKDGTAESNTSLAFPRYAKENLEHLITMLLLYYLHPHPGTKSELPYVDPRRLAAIKTNKAKSKLHFASMFRIVRLDSPPERFGREPRDRPGQGWQLNWRVEVSGYYRWQPWGPNSSFRRWQYIKGYERGPEGAPSKVELTRV